MTALEREIEKAKPVYGNTVHFEIADLVERGIVTVRELDSWQIANARFAWLEGASNSVIRFAYRGRLRRLIERKGRYFSQLFVDRDMMTPQMLLSVCWQKDGTPDRFTRYGEVTMHVGDLADPPLSNQEMQSIAHAAKMQFARVMRSRKGASHDKKRGR